MDTKEFLNPNSMLTPGFAGSVAMMISNTLWVQFGLPQRWTGLGLSFALGLLVLAAAGEAPLWRKGIYYMLNSLVIFSMAVGASVLGTAVASPGKSEPEARGAGPGIARFIGVSEALAQPAAERARKSDEVLRQRVATLERENRLLQEQMRMSAKAAALPPALDGHPAAASPPAALPAAAANAQAKNAEKERKFFQTWF